MSSSTITTMSSITMSMTSHYKIYEYFILLYFIKDNNMSKIIDLINKKYITSVIIVIFVIFVSVFVIFIINAFTNSKEPLDTMGTNTNDIPDLNPATSFCKSYLGNSADLEPACNKLTQPNCNQTSCCVFSNGKCVAGDIHGPTYKTDKSTADTYYYQGQCYGKCSTIL
jgi:hypothetical protein